MAEDSPAPTAAGGSEAVSPKRRKSENHYTDGECSPSKKRATHHLKENESLEFEGRGMLFGVDPEHSKAQDDFDLGVIENTSAAEPEKPKVRLPARSKSLPRIRLVVGADPKVGRRAAR